ncbi:MAG: hypothetical protein O7E52_17825 [Candidatus Poribacteria bacterium]|nr:hypothetical protein [Candidatus Poribacteria bacterium]
MRVKDLIEKLNAFDPTLRVVTPGFDEFDFEDVQTVELVKVVFHDEKKRFHGGRHKESAHGIEAVKVDWQ